MKRWVRTEIGHLVAIGSDDHGHVRRPELHDAGEGVGLDLILRPDPGHMIETDDGALDLARVVGPVVKIGIVKQVAEAVVKVQSRRPNALAMSSIEHGAKLH